MSRYNHPMHKTPEKPTFYTEIIRPQIAGADALTEGQVTALRTARQQEVATRLASWGGWSWLALRGVTAHVTRNSPDASFDATGIPVQEWPVPKEGDVRLTITPHSMHQPEMLTYQTINHVIEWAQGQEPESEQPTLLRP